MTDTMPNILLVQNGAKDDKYLVGQKTRKIFIAQIKQVIYCYR